MDMPPAAAGDELDASYMAPAAPPSRRQKLGDAPVPMLSAAEAADAQQQEAEEAAQLRAAQARLEELNEESDSLDAAIVALEREMTELQVQSASVARFLDE